MFKNWFVFFLFLLISLSLANASFDREGALWGPPIEWELINPDFSGNPFDLIAEVNFTHIQSRETIKTQMFYDKEDKWKFRFTGTRTGEWAFITSSDEPELDGHSGTIIINPNLNPNLNGFLIHKGNKFAVISGENGNFKGYLFNIYMNRVEYPTYTRPEEMNGIWTNHAMFTYDNDKIDLYLNDTEANGFKVIFIHVAYPYVWTDGDNPRQETFEQIELIINHAYSKGFRTHIWMWGDAQRGQTPSHSGMNGINRDEDKRLQRYVAARLGPLPGWTMGYGFDLEEWVTEEQIREWAQYMNQHLGWKHLLLARNRFNSELDVNSYSSYSVRSYLEILNDLNSDLTRPHLYEERHTYLRNSNLDMEGTRRFLWKNSIAGGMGGFWGFYPNSPYPYPNPEQLRTHLNFWENRLLIEMIVDNSLTDGYCIRSPDNKNYIFYKEDTNSIQMDLNNINESQPVVAIDTKKSYFEIEVGNFNKGDYNWQAPYSSDWAIAVGLFDVLSLPPPPDTEAPIRTNPSPTGSLSSGTTQTNISLTTNKNSTCKYSNISNTNFSQMTNTFSITGETNHSQLIIDLQDGENYTFYVRCNDNSGNFNTEDFEISFSVLNSGEQPQPTYPEKIITLQDMLNSYQDYRQDRITIETFLEILRTWIVFR